MMAPNSTWKPLKPTCEARAMEKAAWTINIICETKSKCHSRASYLARLAEPAMAQAKKILRQEPIPSHRLNTPATRAVPAMTT